MIRFRPLPVMTALMIAAFAILLLLGRWQWDRYEQKLRLANEPVSAMTIADYQPIQTGIQFVYGVRADTREQGWRVFAPVQYGDTIVFVDSDFIAGTDPPNVDEVRVPAGLRLGAPISGATIRSSAPGPLVAAPQPLRRLWFAVDLAAMGRNAGFANVADYYVAAAYVGEDGRSIENPFAVAPGAEVLPPERHLGYAITWYGLALVLVIIYFAYHVSLKRLGFSPPQRRD